ncbi:MAG: YihY/virulence factor BrkB family protein [Chitinophagaceae bacterium]|nr:MAG: YihY/virulence factor BrkB family protein [Chitinophagaceae bacterium]
MKEQFKQVFELLKRSVRKFKLDNPLQLAGTTAFFAIFAMAPLIIIIISVAGLLLGQEETQARLFAEIDQLVGEQSALFLRNIVENFQDTRTSIIGTIVGFVMFIFISTTFFSVMQRSLNYIWRIQTKPKNNFLRTLYDRLISFGLILILGFVMLVSFIIDASKSLFKDFLDENLPVLTVYVVEVGNFIVYFALIMVIVALIYRFLPDVHMKWRVTWMGAFITAILFVIGKFIITLGLKFADIGAMYGAAGSLVLILLWVFYSSLIFFFGAEITQQFAKMYSHDIKPKDYAVEFEINEVDRKAE